VDSKKQYQTPELVSLGNFENLTQQGGGSSVDVPFGTSIDAPGGISGNVS